MPADKFSRMPPEDQKSLLVAIFERRLQHAKNLHYELDVFQRAHEDLNGQPGNPLARDAVGLRFRYERWQLGNSYRIDTTKFKPPGYSEPCAWISSCFNDKQGIRRSTLRDESRADGYGRIDTTHDPELADNVYRSWLDGVDLQRQDYLFRYILSRKSEFKLESPVEQGRVQLTIGYQPHWADKPGGKRVFLLDPERGFLPVQGESRCDAAAEGKGKPRWHMERFTVAESKLAGDVWMPTKMRMQIAASTRIGPLIMVYDMTISRIEHNTVRPTDLEVAFRKGMIVVDAVKGVHYIADANGAPTETPKPLIEPDKADSP